MNVLFVSTPEVRSSVNPTKALISALHVAVQAAAAHNSHAKVDRTSHEEVVQAKDQLEQQHQHLQRRLQESEAEAATLQSKLSAAASDLDGLRAQVRRCGHRLPAVVSVATVDDDCADTGGNRQGK